MATSVYKWLKACSVALAILVMGFMPAPTPAVPHPLYISVSEMEYNAKDETFEIGCKVFTDDFEKAMTKANAVLVDLYKPKDTALLNKQVAAYLRQHLLIKIDGKPVTLQYVGHEIEEQSTWSFFQVNAVRSAPKKVEVNNNIFFELYDKQINIMHVSVGGNRKSTKLDYPVAAASFDF